MSFDLSKVEFSKSDIKLGIKIPNKLTEELAYFIGIHVGDGNLFLDKSKNEYLINYSGHLIDEYEFHKDTILPLIKFLFNKNTSLKKDGRINRNSIKIQFRSKAVFTFLSKVIKLTVGNKNFSGVPDVIKNSNGSIKANFLRGWQIQTSHLLLKQDIKN